MTMNKNRKAPWSLAYNSQDQKLIERLVNEKIHDLQSQLYHRKQLNDSTVKSLETELKEYQELNSKCRLSKQVEVVV